MLPWQKKSNSKNSKKPENGDFDSKTDKTKEPPKPRGRPKKDAGDK